MSLKMNVTYEKKSHGDVDNSLHSSEISHNINP